MRSSRANVYVDDPNREPGNKAIRVHYAYSGPENAPTLLLMHGNPSWSFLFREIIPIINAAGYRTVIFDYVGHGRSDKPSRPSDYTYDRQLEWNRQIISSIDAELGLGRVTLMGHDYGHPFGQRLITHYFQDRFDGFINANAGMNRGEVGLAERHIRWREFARRNPDVPIGAVICRNAIPQCPPEVEAGYDAPYPGPEYKASIRAFPEMVPEDTSWPEARANQIAWDYMTSQFTKPYMVIWEHWDVPDARKSRRDEYIEKIPGAYGSENPQIVSGHYSPEDNPEPVAAAVVRFLDDIYTPKPFVRVLFEDFAAGIDGFSCGGMSCSYDPAEQAVQLRGGEEAASSLVQSDAMDLSGATELKVAFRYLPDGMAAGDTVLVELWDGEIYRTILTLTRAAEPGQPDFFNRAPDYGYVRIASDVAPFSKEAKIRIRTKASSPQGGIHLRDIGIFVR
ncbi:MAG: alpha/beta fold hydrolase [Alphaproteobacteria bacterium]|nr:alpha/beta fold hydrolase [Alphaproteobacteria bacterium]